MTTYTEIELAELFSSAVSWSSSLDASPQEERILSDVIFGLDAACELILEYVRVNITLEQGVTVFGYFDENSNSEEFGVIFTIGDQIFRRSGTFDSYDAPQWDSLYEVERTVEIVSKVSYIRKNPDDHMINPQTYRSCPSVK